MFYIILSNLLWMLYSLFEGVREANSKHHKNLSKSLIEIKSPLIYNAQRLIVLFVINLHLWSHISYLAIFSTIAMSLMFPYIHNGTYFLIRNKLNPSIFPKKACEDCDVEIEQPSDYLSSKIRTKLFLIGLAIQIIICFIK